MKVIAKLSTDSPGADYDDDATEIELEIKDANNGVFESKSLLLVSDKVDDEFKADGIADNAKNDRTHIAALEAKVKIEYELDSGQKCKTEADVPVEKIVKVQPFILRGGVGNGFFKGDPVVGVSSVNAHMTKIKERYAQCGIKVDVAAPITVAANPPGVNLINGLDEPKETNPIGIPNETKKLFDGLPVESGVIPIYYINSWEGTPQSPRGRGLTTVPKVMRAADIAAGYGNKILINVNLTLQSGGNFQWTPSHELLHVLLNAIHSDYPAEFADPQMLWHSTSPDDTVSTTKRISKRQCDKAKTF